MEQRALGRSGLKVSRLGLGTMTWGADTDEHESADQLKAFLEAGGTLLDTAAGYSDGESERVIGGLLASVVDREEIVLATKAGVSRRTGQRVVDTSRKAVLDALDGSLQRLGTDRVDLAAATRGGVMVVNAPQSNIVTTAEHAVALLLACARNLGPARAPPQAGRLLARRRGRLS